MLQTTSWRNRLTLFVGIFIATIALLLACPMWAYAESPSDEGSNIPQVEGDYAQDPDEDTGITSVADPESQDDPEGNQLATPNENEGDCDGEGEALANGETPLAEGENTGEAGNVSTATELGTTADVDDDVEAESPASTTEPLAATGTAAKASSTAAKATVTTTSTTTTAAKAAASTTTTVAKRFVIVIDAGHGGSDSGANGYVVEKDVNLIIAKYLRDELAQYSGVEVYMTRSSDTYVSLSDRVKKAVNWNADVVISIHNNAGGGRGAEVIVPNSSSWAYSACYVQGQKLGANILAELKGVGLSVHQGVYSKNSTNNSRYADGSLADYFTLIEGPREHKILGVIVEHAFVDTASDAKFLQGNANLKKLALADARGIASTFNLSKVDITKVKYSTPLAAGTYVIVTSNNGSQVLDVAAGSKANGANVLLWEYHNVSWQKWSVSYDSQGMYIFKNVGTGKVLDAANGTAKSGTNVLTWQAKSSDYYNQRWVLVKSGAGYVIRAALNTNSVLDCMNGSSANGTNIALWTVNGGGNQRFFFVEANPKVAYGKTIANGVYTMGVSNKKTKLVEVEGCSKNNCGNVDIYEINGGKNQQWSFKYNGAGYYKIINVNSGLALDVEGASLAPGTNVLQYKSKSGKNQLWGVQKNSDGTYSIYSALNGMALDVHGASTADLTNVETYFSNGGKNQRFYLEKPKPVSSGYNIMGTSSVTVAQMVKYYNSTGATYPSSMYSSKGAKTINDFAQIAYEEAKAEGVKAEVLFAQAMLETGNLRFGGDVSPSQCNFGGIGATGGGAAGATFSNVRQGLRAQAQHLKAYASTAALNNACVDPRFNLVTRGSAKTVEQLSGKWATGSDYGSNIVSIINRIKGQ